MFKNSPRICFFMEVIDKRMTFNIVPYSSLRLYSNSSFHVVHTLETVEYSWAALTNAAGKHTVFLHGGGYPYTFWTQEHVKNATTSNLSHFFFQNETKKGS